MLSVFFNMHDLMLYNKNKEKRDALIQAVRRHGYGNGGR